MDGEAEAYDDDGDCNGCPDGGGTRRPRGLGEGVAGVVGLRPLDQAVPYSEWSVRLVVRRKRLGFRHFLADEESWNAGKLSLDRGRQAVSIYLSIYIYICTRCAH